MNLFDIYSSEIPQIIKDFADTREFKRLANIGMHCGCEYTAFRNFTYIKDYYRWEHSLGVALIVWNFTKNEKEAVAGLLHDISTPVFSHVVDFLNKDYEKQESTEEKTREIIEKSEDFKPLLKKYSLSVEDICDYHIYPIADNDSPGLSADRLEYHMGNFLCRGMLNREEIRTLYSSIFVAENEKGEKELAFDSIERAERFVELLLSNSRLFVADEDRYAMEYLANILEAAIKKGIVKKEELYGREDEIIEKLQTDEEIKLMWEKYTKLNKLFTAKEKPRNVKAYKVSAKKRYINPLVLQGQSLRRLYDISEKTRKNIDDFLKLDFDYWMWS